MVKDGDGRESGCVGRHRGRPIARKGVWKEVGGEIGEILVSDPRRS